MFEKYINEEGTFLITNKAVARTSIFNKKHHCQRFLYQLKRYVGPLGKIIGYSLIDDEFTFIIKLGSRIDFEKYYIARQIYEGKVIAEIPDSTYIFSQAMANLQSSTVRHFNFKEERKGTLFATRFKKKKIADLLALRAILEKLIDNVQMVHYKARWRDTSFNRMRERKSWSFNFQGIAQELGDVKVWRELKFGLEWLRGKWSHKFMAVLQDRLRKTYFYTQIPFNLPIFSQIDPP